MELPEASPGNLMLVDLASRGEHHTVATTEMMGMMLAMKRHCIAR